MMPSRPLKNSALIATNIPLHLTEDELENPSNVLQDFSESLELDYVRQAMFNMFAAVMLISDEDSDDDFGRADYLFCFKEIQRALEAGHLLGQRLNLKPHTNES